MSKAYLNVGVEDDLINVSQVIKFNLMECIFYLQVQEHKTLQVT